MKKHYRHENDCLNCGTELQGKFCHNCGQENLEMKESFGHMMNHAISDYFHFDYQFFHTLKPLLFKPGMLTNEYLAGRRAQYLHPVKMYIFISLVFFVLLLQSKHEVINIQSGSKRTQQQIKDSVNKVLGNKISLAKKNGIDIKPYTKEMNTVQIDMDDDGKGKDTSVKQYINRQQKLPALKRDNFWKTYYLKKKLAYTEKYGPERATEMFYEDIKHNLPKMMFVLLPLVALIIRLAFLKNKKYYVEYLIFTIHLHCFYFLLAAIVLLVEKVLPQSWGQELTQWMQLGVFIAGVWYVYRALRVFLKRGRLRTITKMIGISIMYLILYVICFLGVILITVSFVG